MNESNTKKATRLWNGIKKNWLLYLFVLPALTYIIIFNYAPMYGILIAFKDFKPNLGIIGSPFTDQFGMAHFMRFFSLDMFWTLLGNTLTLSLYSLLAGFPLPIILALLLNSTRNKKLSRTTQLVTYIPHFISTVVMVGMINVIFSPNMGIVSQIIKFLTNSDEPLMWLANESAFPHMYVWTGVWQSIGWGSIIYLAALAGVSPELHEAAIIDGATRFQRIIKIDLPTIQPIIVIQLILNCGGILNVGFEKAFLMQNALNIGASQVISTYVYEMGLLNAQFSFSTAVGLFNSVINFIMLIIVNKAARKLTDSSLF